MKPEARLENSFAEAYKNMGLLSYHADMLADGFADRLFLYKNNKYFLIEFKVCNTLEINLADIVETSQPPMWYTLATKAKPAYLVVEKSNGLFVFGTDFKNVEDYINPTIDALPFYGVYNSPEEVVRWILPTLA